MGTKKNKVRARLRLVRTNKRNEFMPRPPRCLDADAFLELRRGQAPEYSPLLFLRDLERRADGRSRSAKGMRDCDRSSSLVRGDDLSQRYMRTVPYRPMLAACYSDINSSLQADTPIRLLDHHDMGSIETIKTLRRENVGRLLDAIGQAQLSELTDMNPAFLYQMGKGKDSSARNVSDETVAKIESALGLPSSWMDSEHPESELAGLKQRAGEILRRRNSISLLQASTLQDNSEFLYRWSEMNADQRKKLLHYMDFLLMPMPPGIPQEEPTKRRRAK